MKPAEGFSYAEILQNLKRCIQPDILGVIIRGVRQARGGDVFIEVEDTPEG